MLRGWGYLLCSDEDDMIHIGAVQNCRGGAWILGARAMAAIILGSAATVVEARSMARRQARPAVGSMADEGHTGATMAMCARTLAMAMTWVLTQWQICGYLH